jgi:hypothetical protein
MKPQHSQEWEEMQRLTGEAADRLQSFGLNQTTGINEYTSRDRQIMRAAIQEFRTSLAEAGYKITKR